MKSSLRVFGLNHETAPLALREKMVFDMARVDAHLADLRAHCAMTEAAVLSTCNRTEVYVEGRASVDNIVAWCANYHGVATDTLTPLLYHHEGTDMVAHTMRVAAGLNSQVLGETQILGQLKHAYQHAKTAGFMGGVLGRLFERAFHTAKYVRSRTDIGKYPVSTASIALHISAKIFEHITNERVLMVGAGEMARLCLEQVASRYHTDNTAREHWRVISRTHERAAKLAADFGAVAVDYADLARALYEADIIFCATASPTPIISRAMIEAVLPARHGKPLCILDMSVPRNVAAEVGALDGVYLYDMDDFMHMESAHYAHRRAAARQAESMIMDECAAFMQWLVARDSAPAIQQWRAHMEGMTKTELAKAKRALANGQQPEAVLERLAHRLQQQILHAPTEALRTHQGAELDELNHALKTLFSLT